jgi:asparagine synthase (glutamine-hydrolysing)
MCAIAGQISIIKENNLKSTNLEAANEDLFKHRGPDGYGVWKGENVIFQHWRLAVQDVSSAGHQPMFSSCGEYLICFNGEIYNHFDLRKLINENDLAKNHGRIISWKSHSDTETIIEGYRCFGQEVFEMLNGMFAIAIYCLKTRQVVLSRDRFGIKPLFYHQLANKFLFASEIKYFSCFTDFHAEENPDGILMYLETGQNSYDRRTLSGIYQLEPGTCLTIDSDGVQKSIRYTDRPKWVPIKRVESVAISSVREVLSKAVERQILSDIPVGVFLSGGVDSSIIAYHASRLLGPRNTNCFSLYYKNYGPEFNESDRISQVVKKLGVNHHFIEFDENKLIEGIERFSWYFDEPFGDAAGLNMMVLSSVVKEHVGVALAGEGADELFGGYRRYITVRIIDTLRKIPFLNLFDKLKNNGKTFAFLSRRQKILLKAWLADNTAYRYLEFFSDSNCSDIVKICAGESLLESRRRLKIAFEEHLGASISAQMCLVDQENNLPNVYLEKSDKGSMISSLEVRVPFLDNDVVKFANSLEDKYRVRGIQGKWLLKKAYESDLPRSVVYGAKRGFSVPLEFWFRGPLYRFAYDKMLSNDARSSVYLCQNAIRRILDDNRAGRADHGQMLWRCLTLELWLRNLDKRASDSV